MKFSWFDGISYKANSTDKIARTTLQNGVKLTVYPEKHRKTREFADLCCHAMHEGVTEWPDLCLMKVQIRRTIIRALLEVDPAVPDYICNRAHQKGMNELMTSVTYLSYRGHIHHWNTKKGRQLTAAAACGMKPGVAAIRMQALIYE